MIMKANKQIGFIYKNNESIDTILKDGDVVFEKGFLREKTSTTLPITFGGVGKNLKDYKIYGNTKQQLLPDGYTQVDFIESSGTQYIDTGLKSTPNTKFDFEFTSFKEVGADYEQILGSQFGATKDRIYILIGGSNNIQLQFPHDSNNHLYMNNNGTFTSSSSSTSLLIIEQNKKNRIIFDIPNRSLTVNEYTSVSTGTYDLTSSDYNILLFNRNDTVVPTVRLAKGKLYNFKWYESNVLVRDFIPCYRNSDNEVGLYDLVNNVFYTNQGTGVFTYGSIAPTPDAPIEMISCGDRTKNLLGFGATNTGKGTQTTYDKKTGLMTTIGTTTQGWPWANEFKVNIPKGTTLTISSNSQYQIYARLYYDNSNYEQINSTTGQTRTLTHDIIKIVLLINIPANTTINETYYVQIEENSIATSYEPYGYKIPVNIRSDNLISQTIYQTNTNLNDSGEMVLNNNYFIMKQTNIKPLSKYKLSESQTVEMTGTNTTPIRVCAYDSNDNFLSLVLKNVRTEAKRYVDEFVVPTNTEYILISFRNSDTNIELVESIETNIYLDEPLRKSNDGTCIDYIDFKNSKIIRNIKEIVLNGTETGARAADTSAYYTFAITAYGSITNKNSAINCLSNMFLPSATSIINTFRIATTSGNLAFTVPLDFVSSYDYNSFKTKLQQLYNNGTPVIIIIPLATPTEETITLPNIPTIDGNNTLNIETEITPSQVYIKYKSNS